MRRDIVSKEIQCAVIEDKKIFDIPLFIIKIPNLVLNTNRKPVLTIFNKVVKEARKAMQIDDKIEQVSPYDNRGHVVSLSVEELQ